MKKAISIVLQFLLFYVVFAVGSLLDPFHLKWFIKHPTLTLTSYYVPDGLLLALGLYVLILLLEAATRRLPQASVTTIALLLALVLGLLSKFGFATHDLLG